MLLTQDQLDTFHLDGFVNAGKIYSDAEVDHLREERQLVLDGKNEQSPVLKHYMPGYTIYHKTGRHVMEPSVTVAPGEPSGGEHFPVVYERSNRTKCTECETCVTTA